MTTPKRVAGGFVVLVANKKKTKKQQQKQLLGNAAHPKTTDGITDVSSSSNSGGGGGNTGLASESVSSSPRVRQDCYKNEFDNDDDDYDATTGMDANDIPSDALLCLQAYTRPSNFETTSCAYCPIFTKQSHHFNIDSSSSSSSSITTSSSSSAGIRQQQSYNDENENNKRGDGRSADDAADDDAAAVEISTHAAPMLPKLLLLHHLVNTAIISSTSSSSLSASMMRGHAERAIEHIALSNDVRLLQLHGTAVMKMSSTASSWRGDGNDDDDVVIMETSVYIAAAQMALQTCFGEHHHSLGNDHEHRHQSIAAAVIATKSVDEDATILLFRWFTNVLLPYFAGRTWFSSCSLSSLFHDQNYYHDQNQSNYNDDNNGDDNNGDDNLMMQKKSTKRKYNHVYKDTMSGANNVKGRHNHSTHHRCSYSIKQMERMIQHLVQAGLLLPRRRCGDDDGGYWFSLPGLGKAAKSIVDGRNNLLRRLQSSHYKEKKRWVLERDLDDRGSKKRTKTNGTSRMREVEQSGKFIVLDALSKGWIQIYETSGCTREQFVRLS